jgi:hypothetical protein
MHRATILALLMTGALLIGCDATPDAGGQEARPPGSEAMSESQAQIAEEIGGMLETTGASVESVSDTPPDATVSVVVPSLEGLHERDPYHVLNVLLGNGWEAGVTITFKDVLEDGTVALSMHSLFIEDDVRILERYEGRAASPHDSMTTVEPAGRVEGLTNAEIARIASGEARVPELE